MFEEPGRKLKTFAKVTFWLNVVLSVFTFFGALIAAENEQTSSSALVFSLFLFIALWWFASWGISLFLYGVGELIESNNVIEMNSNACAKPFRQVRSHQ